MSPVDRYFSALPQGRTQFGYTGPGSLYAGDSTSCATGYPKWLEAGLDIRLAVIDGRRIVVLLAEPWQSTGDCA